MSKINNTSVDVNSDSSCFVCGRDNPIGLQAEFTVDHKQNSATARLTIGADFQGWHGVVHGGIIATLLDEAAIYACRPISETAVTAGLTVKYRKPVKVDCPASLLAEVISIKRNIAIVKSQLTVESVVMAEAEVKVMLLNKKTV